MNRPRDQMALLRTLPIDVIKIDRAFVRDLEVDQNAVAIARTIVTLGRSLGLRLIAEGVETPGQADILRAMGGGPVELLPAMRRRSGSSASDPA